MDVSVMRRVHDRALAISIHEEAFAGFQLKRRLKTKFNLMRSLPRIGSCMSRIIPRRYRFKRHGGAYSAWLAHLPAACVAGGVEVPILVTTAS